MATSTDSKGKVKVLGWTHQAYVDAGEAHEGGKVDHFRGVNSIEAYFDGSRWWISSVMGMSESPEHPIPAGISRSVDSRRSAPQNAVCTEKDSSR